MLWAAFRSQRSRMPTSVAWSVRGPADLFGVMIYTLVLCLINPARFGQRTLDVLVSVVLMMKNRIAKTRYA